MKAERKNGSCVRCRLMPNDLSFQINTFLSMGRGEEEEMIQSVGTSRLDDIIGLLTMGA